MALVVELNRCWRILQGGHAEAVGDDRNRGFPGARRGAKLAWRKVDGAGPTVVWLGGFHSDMTGTKAQALAEWAAAQGRGFLRFDYFGHGASEGDFAAGTVTRWRGDALAAIDRLTEEPLVLVGSSMGAGGCRVWRAWRGRSGWWGWCCWPRRRISPSG